MVLRTILYVLLLVSSCYAQGARCRQVCFVGGPFVTDFSLKVLTDPMRPRFKIGFSFGSGSSISEEMEWRSRVLSYLGSYDFKSIELSKKISDSWIGHSSPDLDSSCLKKNGVIDLIFTSLVEAVFPVGPSGSYFPPHRKSQFSCEYCQCEDPKKFEFGDYCEGSEPLSDALTESYLLRSFIEE